MRIEYKSLPSLVTGYFYYNVKAQQKQKEYIQIAPQQGL